MCCAGSLIPTGSLSCKWCLSFAAIAANQGYENKFANNVVRIREGSRRIG